VTLPEFALTGELASAVDVAVLVPPAVYCIKELVELVDSVTFLEVPVLVMKAAVFDDLPELYGAELTGVTIDATGVVCVNWPAVVDAEFAGVEAMLPEALLVEASWIVIVILDAVGVVTGQMVVYSEMVSVVKEPILAGQSVTVAAQEVIV
jgi:hypothetical protein